ncbi:MAG: hypothetical protein AB7P02_10320 [Alphaproteobacteria bacterium]
MPGGMLRFVALLAAITVAVAGEASALQFSVRNCTGTFGGVTVFSDWFNPAVHDASQPAGYDWWAPGDSKQFSCDTSTCKVRIRIPGGADVWPSNPIVTGDICIQTEGGVYWPVELSHPQCGVACKSTYNP